MLPRFAAQRATIAPAAADRIAAYDVYKVAFSPKALSDAPPDVIAKVAVEFQTRLTTGGIEGLIEASSDIQFVEDADVRCLICGGPLGADRDMPAHPGALRCYVAAACAKNSYIVASSKLGRDLLEAFEEDSQREDPAYDL